MSTAQQLRARDLRDIDLLVGECQELWHDPLVWRSRMYEGLCDLIGAQCAIGGERIGIRLGSVETVHTVAYGLWPAAFERFQHYLARRDYAIDMPDDRMHRTLKTLRQRVLTADQLQFVDARQWRRSELYNEYFRPTEIEHRILSYCELPCAAEYSSPSVHQGVTLYRLRGEKPFGERERQIVQHFQEQCRPLVGSALTGVAVDPLAELPPRVGQALMLLLEGEGEKQAAARMGISRHTLHDYVKHLHRHFGVSYRRQLVVRCRALVARAQAVGVGTDRATLANAVDALSPRVRETLRLLLRGGDERAIARQMGISKHTVRDYAKRLYDELAVCSRAQLFHRCAALNRHRSCDRRDLAAAKIDR